MYRQGQGEQCEEAVRRGFEWVLPPDERGRLMGAGAQN
jgi:hypothetical protein